MIFLPLLHRAKYFLMNVLHIPLQPTATLGWGAHIGSERTGVCREACTSGEIGGAVGSYSTTWYVTLGSPCR